jgi:hypothetical protein
MAERIVPIDALVAHGRTILHQTKKSKKVHHPAAARLPVAVKLPASSQPAFLGRQRRLLAKLGLQQAQPEDQKSI